MSKFGSHALVSALALLLASCAPAPEDDPVGAEAGALNIPKLPGGGGGTPTPSPGSGPGQLRLDQQLVYFGQTCPGDSASKVLSMTNMGSTDLLISGLTISGGDFSMLDAPPLPATLRPGRKLALTLSVTVPTDRPDLIELTGTLRIRSNDSRGTVTVSLRGLVPPPVLQLSPRELDFGEHFVDDVALRRVTLRNTGLCPLEVTGATVEGASRRAITVDSLPTDILYPGESYRANIIMQCQEEGELDAQVSLLGQDRRRLSTVTVSGLCY